MRLKIQVSLTETTLRIKQGNNEMRSQNYVMVGTKCSTV